MSSPPPGLVSLYEAAGQGHIFQFWSELNDEERQELLADAAHMDPNIINANFKLVIAQEKQAVGALNVNSSTLSPFTNVVSLNESSDFERKEWYHTGLTAIAAGQVATILMAGGQGTRLGSNDPKGCFDIGLPSHKSLFQLQAERLQRLRQIAADHVKKPVSSVSIPWYIMTSIITHAPTMKFFQSHNYFSLPSTDVFFFRQRELPALSNSGQILLESKSKVALAPNGNGGIFEALHSSGALLDMSKRNIIYTQVYGVDNILIKIADPTFIGFGITKKADCVNKVVLKTESTEKVGVMAYKNNTPTVVEYSEIPKALSESRDNNGKLLYNAGNIAQHFFTTSFLSITINSQLPFHIAKKHIPYIDQTGTLITPTPPTPTNGLKLEMFIFDIMERTNNIFGFAVNREEEFAAVKNKSGLDSPESARIAYSNLWKSKIEENGGIIIGDDIIEISPLLTYEGEGLDTIVRGKTFNTPFEIK